MDKNQGYAILKAVMLENGRGFALGENPAAPSPYVTWACYDDKKGQRQYEWGHYGSDLAAMEQDLTDRVQDYQRLYHVEAVGIEAPGLYKYYSTQRPVDIGTFPKPPRNAPDEIVNYDQRVPVEGGAFLAWGHLTYTKPLTEKQMADYELRPSPQNPDLRKRIAEQAQIVGKWEDEEKRPEWQRITQWDADQGAYAALDTTPPEQLSYCVRLIEAQRAARKRQPPIAEQLKEAGRLAQENRGQPGPKKDAPDRGDR